jgi:hypothetical protein
MKTVTLSCADDRRNHDPNWQHIGSAAWAALRPLLAQGVSVDSAKAIHNRGMRAFRRKNKTERRAA